MLIISVSECAFLQCRRLHSCTVCRCASVCGVCATSVLELCVMNNKLGSCAACIYDSAVALMLLKTLSRLFTLMRAGPCYSTLLQCTRVCIARREQCVWVCVETWLYLWMRVGITVCVSLAQCLWLFWVVWNVWLWFKKIIKTFWWMCETWLDVWLDLRRCKTIVHFFLAILQYVLSKLSLFLIPHPPTHTHIHTISVDRVNCMKSF